MDAAPRERSFNLLRHNQRTRRVVHGNVFRFAIDAIQAGPNGILPAFAAGDDCADFFEPCSRRDFSDFAMTLFTRHDEDFAYRSRALERTNCVSDNWLTGDDGKQLIKPHSLAAAAGYDDG